ncbi:MAG: hypothetical protein J2P44_13085 [Candidatus Dormibacteraeota bacterium]|nr:hypothetical protein [Candidatus Dormibacteraeota bacterium]
MPAGGGGGGTGSPAATATPGSAGGPQATAEKDLSLVASSGDGLAWPAVLGGVALFAGLALLMLARRSPNGTRGRRR